MRNVKILPSIPVGPLEIPRDVVEFLRKAAGRKPNVIGVVITAGTLREMVRALTPMKPINNPRGYVFVDREGDAWGYRRGSMCLDKAMCPFSTAAEAQAFSEIAPVFWGPYTVRVWRKSDRVPPMPKAG